MATTKITEGIAVQDLETFIQSIEAKSKGKIRFARGEERYELQGAFGDECDYVVNVITGQVTYFNY